MKISIAADHAGFELKNQRGDALRPSGQEACGFGTNSAESGNYPGHAARVAKAVAAERGVPAFLETPFDGGRHERRAAKISQMEDNE